MQTVGAQWLLVDQPHASILVALVQTADMLPDVIFGVVGGVLADMFDRRRLLIAVQAFMAVTGLALTVLTFAGQMPPALLLTFTFVLGVRLRHLAAGVPVTDSRARSPDPDRRRRRRWGRSASTWPARSDQRSPAC